MAQYEDLYVDQGADCTFQIQLLNSDLSKRDITDYQVTAKLNRNYDADSDESVAFSTTVEAPATAGILSISLSNTQTRALNYKKQYVYDVDVTYDDGGQTTIERILEGKVIVNPSVTRT